MSSSINMNDKVKNDYQIYISIKEEEDDMNYTINEFIKSHNYEEISRFKDLNNVVVIIRKKVDG